MIFQTPPMSFEEVAAAMVNAGLLQRFGARRGTFYQAAHPLKAICDEARKSRKPIDTGSLFAIAD